MPELPDVEIFRKTIDKKAVHHVIEDFVIDIESIFKSPVKQLEDFKGHRASSSRRIGKYCFLKSGNAGWLVFHFGMTGYVEYFEKEEDKPEYAAFTLVLKGKGKLSYITKRKLGKVEICKTPDNYARDNNLGIDALECNKAEFLKLLGRKKGNVKSALMDQSLISGIGNIYSDEILFQAKIHPKASLKDIPEKKRELIYNKMKEVLKKAIEKDAVPDRFPENYLLGSREEGKACPVCKSKISKISVSGRSTYYCPSCQKK